MKLKNTKIVTIIETSESLENLKSIIKASDVIMDGRSTVGISGTTDTIKISIVA